MHSTNRLRARLSAIVFLAAVGGTVVLLIAGYGVAIGLGAIAGLLLGFLAGAFGAMWLGRGPGRSVSFANLDWSSEDQLSSDRPQTDLLAEMQELFEIGGIDLGAIQSVTPVLVTVDAGGLSVELVSIEQRSVGLALTLDVRVHPGSLPPASMARVSVTDDVGTLYRASAQGQGAPSGPMRYAVSVIPAFPRSATRLEVAIERFIDPFPGGGRGVVGPWGFSVGLS